LRQPHFCAASAPDPQQGHRRRELQLAHKAITEDLQYHFNLIG